MTSTDDFSKGKRGAVTRTPKGKSRITIRIDDDVLVWFREQVNAAGGGNYQSMSKVDHRLGVSAAGRVDLLTKPVQYVIVDPYGDPGFSFRSPRHRATFSF